SLLFVAQAKHDTPPGYGDLYAFDLAGKVLRDLSDGFDGSIHDEPPVALADGSVVGLAESGLDIAVATWPAAGGAPRLTHLPVAVTVKARTNAARSGWLFLGSSGDHPPELLYAAAPGETPKPLAL